jgi:glycerophosphoryl diester phosphodiesterase
MASQLIAHRGLPYQFPENSLGGFAAAIRGGATWCETDVQLTADGVPLLFHDADTRRLCGGDGQITRRTLADLQRSGVYHPERFGARFRGTPLTTLRQLLQLLSQHPAVRLFLELKCESESTFGAERFVDITLSTLAAFHLADRVVPISFSEPLLRTVRAKSNLSIGWVTDHWRDRAAERLAEWRPDYLFIDRCLIDEHAPGLLAESPWQGPWQTVVYTVNDESTARQLLTRGYLWLETDRFDELNGRA